MRLQKEHVEKKKLSSSTVANYHKSLKLFCISEILSITADLIL